MTTDESCKLFPDVPLITAPVPAGVPVDAAVSALMDAAEEATDCGCLDKNCSKCTFMESKKIYIEKDGIIFFAMLL